MSEELRVRAKTLERNAILCKPTRVRPGEALAAGRSKLGGLPDMAHGEVWPRRDEAMAFIGQINLAEVKPYDREGRLPADGLLRFFYDDSDYEFGQVLYTRSHELHKPAPLFKPYPECELAFSAQMVLPDYTSLEIKELKLSEEEVNEYFEGFYQELDSSFKERTWLLGHATPIQDEMRVRYLCEEIGQKLEFHLEDDPDFRRRAMEWTLLFQADSEKEADMLWGDLGMVYFWIKREDLARADFSRVRVEMQCS